MDEDGVGLMAHAKSVNHPSDLTATVIDGEKLEEGLPKRFNLVTGDTITEERAVKKPLSNIDSVMNIPKKVAFNSMISEEKSEVKNDINFSI